MAEKKITFQEAIDFLRGEFIATAALAETLVKENRPAQDLAALFLKVRGAQDLFTKTGDVLAKVHSDLALKSIPDAFERDKVTSITLDAGFRVTVSQNVRASTKDMDAGIKFFKRCTCGHDPDRHLSGVGKCRECKSCKSYDAPNAKLVKETINAQTLASFAKGEMEEGRELPDDVFNVHVMPNTSITKVK